jgi:hypothetical protein
MPAVAIFNVHLVLGYVTCLLFFRTYLLPRLRAMDRFHAHRAFATLHSFRFFGLVFLLPGVVGPGLPAAFTTVVAYGDLATGLLALGALLTTRVRPLFWSFVVAFNIVGAADILIDYYNAVRLNVPAIAGQMGAAYVIPVLYVPMIMITHAVALYWLLRPHTKAAPALAGNPSVS